MDLYLVTEVILIFILLSAYNGHLVSVLQGNCSSFGLTGDITQENVLRFAGEHLELHCNLSSLNQNRSFDTDGRKVKFYTIDVDHNRIQVDNVSVTANTSKNVSVTMWDRIDVDLLRALSSRHYTCEFHSNNAMCIIDQIYIILDHRPQSPINQSCVVSNWRNMICRWDLGVNYKNYEPRYMSRTVQWSSNSTWLPCPRLTADEGRFLQCEWDNLGRDSLKQDSEYKFRINITNNRRGVVNVSVGDNVLIQNIVKPASVDHLTATPYKSSIFITWTNSDLNEQKQYRIQYTSKWYDYIWQVILLKGTNINNYTLDNCTPYTEYRINVDVIPLISGLPKGFRSDVAEIGIKTLQDVPRAVPLMLPYFYTCVDLTCNNITFYWQPIEMKQRNGALKAYRISLVDLTKNQTDIIEETDTSVTSYNVPINNNHTYRIKLTQSNRKGFPKMEGANITIPKMYTDMDVPTVFVESNGTHVNVCWESKKLKSSVTMQNKYTLIGYGIVWCRRSKLFLCEDGIVTQRINSSQSNFVIKMNNLNYSDYQFGISSKAQTSDGRIFYSTIKWSNSEFQKYGVLDKPLDVKVTSDINDNESICWRRYKCEKSRGFVTGYIITSCKVGNGSGCSENTKTRVGPQMSCYSLSKFRKGQRFSIWVEAMIGNIAGPKSDKIEWISKPAEKVQETSVILLILPFLGVSLGFIIIATVTYRAKKCYKRESDSVKDIDTSGFKSIKHQSYTLTNDQIEEDETFLTESRENKENVYVPKQLQPKQSNRNSLVKEMNDNVYMKYVQNSERCGNLDHSKKDDDIFPKVETKEEPSRSQEVIKECNVETALRKESLNESKNCNRHEEKTELYLPHITNDGSYVKHKLLEHPSNNENIFKKDNDESLGNDVNEQLSNISYDIKLSDEEDNTSFINPETYKERRPKEYLLQNYNNSDSALYVTEKARDICGNFSICSKEELDENIKTTNDVLCLPKVENAYVSNEPQTMNQKYTHFDNISEPNLCDEESNSPLVSNLSDFDITESDATAMYKPSDQSSYDTFRQPEIIFQKNGYVKFPQDLNEQSVQHKTKT